MSGDDLAIRLFFLSLAVPAFGLEAVKAETLPRRIVFGVFSIICLLTAIFWLQLKTIWPPLTEAVTSVATNPIAWFVVFMFILAVMAFHRPKEQRKAISVSIPPSSPLSPPLPSPSLSPITQAAQEKVDLEQEIPKEKEFVDVTPQYLQGLRRQKNISSVQIDRILAPYIGKWIKVTGVVTEVYRSTLWLRVENEPKKLGDEQYNAMVMLVIPEKERERFHLLELNKTISAIGQISAVSSHEVELENCELASSTSS